MQELIKASKKVLEALEDEGKLRCIQDVYYRRGKELSIETLDRIWLEYLPMGLVEAYTELVEALENVKEL